MAVATYLLAFVPPRVLPLIPTYAELRGTLPPRALDLCRRMSREQSPKEMAQDMGLSQQHVRRLITALAARTGLSPLRLAMFGAWLVREEAQKASVLDTTDKNPA